MNLSIHLALTLNYLFYLWCGYSHIFFNVMSLPSLFCLYSKMSKLIQDQNIRRTLPTRPDKNLELSAKLFLYLYFIYICFVFYLSFSILEFYFIFHFKKMKIIIIIFFICFFKSKNSSFFIHRSSFRH